jgi:ketosteroid isomerase-like protein
MRAPSWPPGRCAVLARGAASWLTNHALKRREVSLMTTQEEILALGRRWVDAELNGDAEQLDKIAVDDFRLVGPAGFVLDRDQWLDRFGPDKLDIERLDWTDVEVREYGDAVIAIGIQSQRATFAGNRADGSFRVSHVAVRTDGTWRLAGLQFSPLGGPGPFAQGGRSQEAART